MEATGRPSPPEHRPENVRPRPTRRVVVKRKVSNATYERHKEQMEHLGLDVSDPLPPQPSHLEEAGMDDPDVTEADLPSPQAGLFPPAGVMKASPSTQVMQAASKGKERKTVSLKTRTLEEQIVAGRYERALDRWGQQQQEWEQFRHLAARKTGRDKEELVVTRAEEHRERLEVMELLDRATPDEIKGGGFNWYHSLRGGGTRFIRIGNMFSGLYLPMKLHKENYVHEIIRKPLMVDLTTARHAAEAAGRRRPRSWRDDEYLLTRIRKYGGRMKEMAPGLLEYDEILEPDVKSLRPGASAEPGGGAEDELMGALKEEGGAVEHLWHMEQDELAGAGMVPSEGPHAEVSPEKLHFQADVKRQSTRTLELRNTGTAVVQFEWVQNLPEQSFQESILPQDATPYFTCHQTAGRILPGEVVQTMFSFTADRPGNFTSSWCLKTYPHLKKPITELAMNASATLSDLHWERRSALQEYIRKEQTISLASELAEDIVDAVRLQPPPLPPLSEPAVQERLFEEVNAAEGLFWSPQTWETLTALREKVESMVPEKPKADEGNKIPSFVPRPGRGHAPVPKVEPPSAAEPLPPLESLGVPSISRLREQLDELPGTEPGAEKPAEKYEVIRQLERAGRTARTCPLERSPVWLLAYQTVMDIAMTIPGKWAATRQRNSLEPLPFLPPPEDDATPEELEEYNVKLEERKAKLAPEEKEAEVREIFCRGFAKNKFGPACGRFGAVAKESTFTMRVSRAGTLSLGDRLRPYLGRLSSEAIEMASNVVLYEADMGFMAPPMAADGEERPSLVLQGSDLELLKQRLRGVVSVLESVPLAVLVLVHLGEPKPDKPKVEDDATENSELQEVQQRMNSLASVEPIMEILREVVGSMATSCEFVPHEVWLGSTAEFAQKVRNEDVEGKVFLLENMSAVAEETGVRRSWFAPSTSEGQTGESEMEVALHRLPWATREGWAARVFRDLQPESFVQDSLAQSCQSMTLSTGLWPRAPQRVVGPSIEVELAAFLDVLQLPIRATAAEEEAARAELEQSVAVDDDGKAAAPAPLLIVLGGGNFAAAGEEVLLKKLELLIGLSRLAEYEKGGLHVMVAGELATAFLRGVLGMPLGDGGLALDGAIKGALREALLEVLRTGVTITLPLDVVCQAEGEEPPPDAKEHGNGIVVPLAASWKEAAGMPPVFLGVAEGRDCYMQLDVVQGLVRLRTPEDEAAAEADLSVAAGPEAPEAPEAPDADAAPDAAPEAEAEPDAPPPGDFPGGVPSTWRVKDVGPATAEQIRMLLRRSRGAVWNGSLGHCEEGFEKGTQDFLAMLESRLTGAGEDEEDEEDEEPEDEGDDEEGDDESGDGEKEEQVRKESKPKERRAEFEMAAVLGRDSRKLLENLAENPANVPFISGTGEGLLQILRDGSVPGLKACDSKKPV